jgi:hypothetical protein
MTNQICFASLKSISDEPSTGALMEMFPKGNLFASCARVIGMHQLNTLNRIKEQKKLLRSQNRSVDNNERIDDTTLHDVVAGVFMYKRSIIYEKNKQVIAVDVPLFDAVNRD